MADCTMEERTSHIAMAYRQCVEHGHPEMVSAAFDADGVSIDAVIQGTLAILEQLIAAKYTNEEGPLKDLVEGVYRGTPLDATEKPRLANLVANQLLLMTVRRRKYAVVPQFSVIPVEDDLA